MPRPTKPVETLKAHRSKDEKLIRLEQEKILKLDRADLLPPTWMEEDITAYKEYVRVVENTAKIGILDNLDASVLTIYAQAYSDYIKHTLAIREEGSVIGDKLSPHVTAQNKCAEQIFKCSTKLGLATTDRLKLIVPERKDKEVNKYIKYCK